MANLTSPFTTYSDVTPQKRVITDYITLIDPSDAPLVEALGGLDGAASKFKFLNQGTTVEWLEDTLTPLDGVLAHSTESTLSTDTTFTVADSAILQPGHIIKIGAENMWVSGVSGSVITVSRGFTGGTASFTRSASFQIVGMARLEGADSDALGYTDRTVGSNFTQIFHQEIHVTETQQVIDQYGISNEFDYQAKKAVPSLMRLIERATRYGTAGAGSSTTPRTMGGFTDFITTNLQGGGVVQTSFENAVKNAYEKGGSGPWIAACSPTNLMAIKAIYDSSNFLRVAPDQKSIGMVIETIITPFGNVSLLLDRWMTDNRLPLIDAKHAGFLTLRPFTQEPLAKTGDSIKGQVVGEFTFCLRQEKAHAMLTAS